MFGSRTVLAAIGVITLGAMSVVAQTDAQRDKFRNCSNSVRLMDPVGIYYFEYDDVRPFTIQYEYDPLLCDSTIPVNYIRLEDYVGGSRYTCTREQFSPDRNTISSTCSITQ